MATTCALWLNNQQPSLFATMRLPRFNLAPATYRAVADLAKYIATAIVGGPMIGSYVGTISLTGRSLATILMSAVAIATIHVLLVEAAEREEAKRKAKQEREDDGRK